MTDDRRVHSRIAFHSPAELIFTNRNIEIIILDISLKGALVRLPADTLIEDGATCMLHVHLNEGELSDQISMETRVAHVEGRNAGLLCLTIDLDSVTHLRRLVELNLGEPDLLERELSALVDELTAGATE
ncbi:PilZ domain-containing protein [Propionivibrio sp.]|uniref:PilZ domain-containing protein n=1 Tax=Propionivibrio sp. TaxID=2212460 RepID=UPI003BF0A3AC